MEQGWGPSLAPLTFSRWPLKRPGPDGLTTSRGTDGAFCCPVLKPSGVLRRAHLPASPETPQPAGSVLSKWWLTCPKSHSKRGAGNPLWVYGALPPSLPPHPRHGSARPQESRCPPPECGGSQPTQGQVRRGSNSSSAGGGCDQLLSPAACLPGQTVWGCQRHSRLATLSLAPQHRRAPLFPGQPPIPGQPPTPCQPCLPLATGWERLRSRPRMVGSPRR